MSKPKSPRRQLDIVVCERVIAGEWHQVTDDERRYIVDVMTRQGSSALDIARVLQIEKRSVERIKSAAANSEPEEPVTELGMVRWPGPKRDELAVWAEREAAQMATNVRDIDPHDVWVHLSHLTRIELQTLVIGLAAMVPDDRNREQMLAWCNGLEAVS